MCHRNLHLQHQGGRLHLLPPSNPGNLIQHTHCFLDQAHQLQVPLQLASLQITQHTPGVQMQPGSLLLLLMGMP